MEKIITIGAQEVRLKASAKLALICLSYFQKDVFEFQAEFFSAQAEAAKHSEELEKAAVIFRTVKMTDILQLIWAMAKCADDGMLDYDSWLDTLDALPGLNIVSEIFLFLAGTSTTTTKIKNAKAAESSRRKA